MRAACIYIIFACWSTSTLFMTEILDPNPFTAFTSILDPCRVQIKSKINHPCTNVQGMSPWRSIIQLRSDQRSLGKSLKQSRLDHFLATQNSTSTGSNRPKYHPKSWTWVWGSSRPARASLTIEWCLICPCYRINELRQTR